ncbi:MAG: ankyrin repeat domain-containing protein [Magnetococcales bacterium]|nr:ankyrin repeat domain-containing protein [Magnetococcales bacterium]
MNHLLRCLAVVGLLGATPVAFAADETPPAEIMRYAIEGNLDGVVKALEQGAAINQPSQTGMTPLMWAIQESHFKLIDMLLEKGADVNAFHPRAGCTALILASEWLQPQTVDALLKREANVNYQTNHGWSALLKTSRLALKTPEERARQKRVVESLLAHGAKIDARDNKERTSLMLAAKVGNTELVAQLLEHKADINAQDKTGNSALMLAAQEGQLESVKLLLKHNASLEKNHICGCTALLQAAEHGHTEVVKTLLDHHADIHVKNEDGMTALMFASMKGHLETVALLLERGSRINEMNNKGVTARLMAVENHHEKVEQLLQESGGRCY